MNGHLKSITLNISQESWKLDLPEDPVPAARGVQDQHQGPPPRVPMTTSQIAPSRDVGTSAPVQKIKNV
jgi:hypothetical protein